MILTEENSKFLKIKDLATINPTNTGMGWNTDLLTARPEPRRDYSCVGGRKYFL
jgi:hypothetical protein